MYTRGIKNIFLTVGLSLFINTTTLAAGWTKWERIDQVWASKLSIRVSLVTNDNVNNCMFNGNVQWFVANKTTTDNKKDLLAVAITAKSLDRRVRMYTQGCVNGGNSFVSIVME